MSSSSSEDEMIEAFKESAGCDYITQMVDAPKKPKSKEPTGQDRHEPNVNAIDQGSQSSNRANIDDEGSDKFKETGFEKFLASRLANRLEENIKIVEKKRRSVPSDDNTSECGIRLFSCSPKVSELIETTYAQPVAHRKRTLVPAQSIDYSGRAEEAAVPPQWVTDRSNTAFWKDNKKPRVISAKFVKNLSNGGLECVKLTS